LATASCDLWQNEQRRISSGPDLFFTRLYSFEHLAGGFHQLGRDQVFRISQALSFLP